MRAYAVRRLLMVIPTLFLVTVLVFLSVRFLPGDVIGVMQMRAEASQGGEIDRAALERRLGLDVPVYVQYGRWIGGIVLHGTLGQALMGGDTVEQSIAERLPVTVQLGLMAIVIGLVIAVPVGIYSAIRQDTAADYVGRSLAILGLATPNFWLATMVILFPAIWWRWSPPLVLTSFAEDPLRSLAGFAVPSLILGTYLSAATMRMTRTMMLEVLRQDYIRTAWAKGLLRALGHPPPRDQERAHSGGERWWVCRYRSSSAARSSWSRCSTIPGLGRLHDRRPVRSATIRSSPASTCSSPPWRSWSVNLLVDVLYAYLDPRVQYG